MKLTERFTRIGDTRLEYRFTIDDQTIWTRPWTGMFVFDKDDSQYELVEYACHEGNYSMTNILSGARVQDGSAPERRREEVSPAPDTPQARSPCAVGPSSCLKPVCNTTILPGGGPYRAPGVLFGRFLSTNFSGMKRPQVKRFPLESALKKCWPSLLKLPSSCRSLRRRMYIVAVEFMPPA